jgi:uncharacterized protein YggE
LILSAQHTLVALAAAALVAAVLPGISGEAAAQEKSMERTVTVSATGSAEVEPDLAQVSTGVVSEAGTAKEAIERNKAGMSKLTDGMKKAGIDARDIRTTVFNVEPRYTQPKDGRSGVINGYRVMNQVRLTVRNVGRLGDVLDQAIALGANQVNHIAFDVANDETLKDDARKLAMTNARRRAELYAKAAGAELGQVLRIFEQVIGHHAPVDGRVAMRASVPIEPGTRTLEVEVHVTYALR